MFKWLKKKFEFNNQDHFDLIMSNINSVQFLYLNDLTEQDILSLSKNLIASLMFLTHPDNKEVRDILYTDLPLRMEIDIKNNIKFCKYLNYRRN